MNRVTKALWQRRLAYRRNRLKYWRKRHNRAKIAKWTASLLQAQRKLGLVKPPKAKAPVPKPEPRPKPKPIAKKKQKGIDVYEGDGSINWEQVKKAGYTFAFCKTSEGGDWADPSWNKARVDGIRKASIKLGVYHFLRPKAGRSGAVEAKFFIKTAKAAGWGAKGDLVPVIDFEATTLSPAATVKYLAEVVTVIKRLTGKAPIIYTGGPFWDENTNSSKDGFGCALWLAAYVTDPAAYLPTAWKYKGWAIWQHSDKGKVPGVSAANVDQNISKRLPSL